MLVFLDDEREAPKGWVRVRWPEEAIELLKTGKVEAISLDHDLGDDTRGDGYSVLLWIEGEVAARRFVPPPNIYVHTANTPARVRMESAVAAIRRLTEKSEEQDDQGQE